MEALWKALTDLASSVASFTTPQGWGFMALGATCVGMMWYFNSAGHQKRTAQAIADMAEQKRLLDICQQTIAEAFEAKHLKGEITDKDKEALYSTAYKLVPKMKELKPDSNTVATHLLGMGMKLRTRWPFRSKADEARADHAALLGSINAAKK